jgi:polar amino acid transport system substrate-binding protein
MWQRTLNQSASFCRRRAAILIAHTQFARVRRVALLVFSLPFLLLAVPGLAQELIVQADRWCPYNCDPGAAEPGYAIELMQTIFAPAGVKIKYEIVPWDRALMQAQDGTASAAVAAVRVQADTHGLLVGNEPIGTSNDCLFVAASNPLKFQKADDLDSLKAVAIVSGYTYSQELGVWLDRPENKHKILIQRGARPAESNAMNLALGRLDGVVENRHVMQHTIFKLGLEHQVISAGCQKEVPVYIAFNANLENVQQLIKKLDDGIDKLRREKQLAKILGKYGLNDWK